jgi:hypothetical protein
MRVALSETECACGSSAACRSHPGCVAVSCDVVIHTLPLYTTGAACVSVCDATSIACMHAKCTAWVSVMILDAAWHAHVCHAGAAKRVLLSWRARQALWRHARGPVGRGTNRTTTAPHLSSRADTNTSELRTLVVVWVDGSGGLDMVHIAFALVQQW